MGQLETPNKGSDDPMTQLDDDSSPYLRKLSRREVQHDDKYLLVLTTQQSIMKQVLRNQENAFLTLNANQVRYKELDGSNPRNKDKRDRLFRISGIQANFPQFFIVQDYKDIDQDQDWEGSTTFWGDYAKFETCRENNTIAKEFWGESSVGTETPAKLGRYSVKKRFGKPVYSKSDPRVKCLILVFYTLLVMSIPLLITLGPAEERSKLVLQILGKDYGPLVANWTRVRKKENLVNPEETKRDDFMDLSTIDKTWSNPMNDKDFFANIFGAVDLKIKDMQEKWKDPFDWFEGKRWDDQELKSFLKNVGQFLKEKKNLADNFRLEEILTKFLAQKAEPFTTMERKSFGEMISILAKSSSEVFKQVNQTFRFINLERFDLLQFLYFMDYEESRKHAVWKRRMHRYKPELPLEAAMQLYDGLYLSQLAYAPSCHEINRRIQTFRQGLWTLRNCTVDALVHQPAHYVLVRKLGRTAEGPLRERRRGRNFLQFLLSRLFPNKRQQLEVAIVIRGSKEFFDFLTNGMLEAADYGGGKAHDGILRAAEWIHRIYHDDLEQFWKKSQKQYGGSKKPLKLWLIGHSLGGGTASLATMLFRDGDSTKWLDAEGLGFGTPQLVSPDLSGRYHDYITTVVNDADLVPRMSGKSIVNAWRNVITYNWTDAALEDYDQLVDMLLSDPNIQKNWKARAFLKQSGNNVRQWLGTWFDKNVVPFLKDTLIQDLLLSREKSELIPPGECIHLYRDGVLIQGNYVNCSFFDQLDIVRHSVEDHLIPPGYYRALLGFVRDKLGNITWTFDNDILELDY